MTGCPKIIRTPEELKELQKKQREKNKKYSAKYSKLKKSAWKSGLQSVK